MTSTSKPATQYRIIDNHTKQQIGKLYTSRVRATRRRDKLDLQYGAIRYRVERVEVANNG